MLRQVQVVVEMRRSRKKRLANSIKFDRSDFKISNNQKFDRQRLQQWMERITSDPSVRNNSLRLIRDTIINEQNNCTNDGNLERLIHVDLETKGVIYSITHLPQAKFT